LVNPAVSSILSPSTEATSSFITPCQPVPQLNIAYFIPSDNLDSIPPVFINIESLNEEPDRLPTPEASTPPLPPPPIQNLPPLNNMAQNQALQDATNAMNTLAIAMGQDTEKSLLKIDFF
ncbi:42332_t:CDS:2, partial [Gigaspora margarita]